MLATLPPITKKKYETKLAKSQWHWRVQGGARSQEFIAQLEREGWKIRRTYAPAPRGRRTKELVYIDEMRDDTAIDEFHEAPTWKRFCVAIMKNDSSCLTMGFSRTPEQLALRAKALLRYKKLKMPKELQGKPDKEDSVL